MKTKSEACKLRKNVIFLREENKRLREKIDFIENDRTKLRNVFVSNLRCSIELLGKGQTWNMEYVVKTLSEQMTKFERWYWG